MLHRFTGLWLAPALLAASASASALEIPGYLGVGYVDSDVKAQAPGVGSGSRNGDGFLGELMMPVGKTAFLHGDYQAVEYDKVDLDLNVLRVGLGFRLPLAQGITATFSGQYWDVEQKTAGSTFKDDGIGIKAGMHVDMNRPVTGWVNLSYLEFDQSSGSEMEIGMDLRITQMMATFISYRVVDLDADDASMAGLKLDEIRAGVRLWYDAGD